MNNAIHMATCCVCGEDVDTRDAAELPRKGPGRLFRHTDCPAPAEEIQAREQERYDDVAEAIAEYRATGGDL